MRAPTALAAIAVACLLTGCQAGIFREWDMDGGTSLSLDASQRLVFVTDKGGRSRDRRIVCAEPSPDSITSLAATFAASGAATNNTSRPVIGPDGKAVVDAEGKPVLATDDRDAKAALAASYAQNAAFIGMRTQTIQLLRDGLFRACEAYMNGAIDEVQYNMLLVNMPKTMAALVAMDGLTGRPSAPPVILNAPVVTSRITPAGSADGLAGAEATSEKVQVVEHKYDVLQTADRSSAAVRDIALSVTQYPTMHGLCVSIMAAHPDADDPRAKGNWNPHFEDVAKMCRQIFAQLAKRPVARY